MRMNIPIIRFSIIKHPIIAFGLPFPCLFFAGSLLSGLVIAGGLS